jgi:hypothetical protein
VEQLRIAARFNPKPLDEIGYARTITSSFHCFSFLYIGFWILVNLRRRTRRIGICCLGQYTACFRILKRIILGSVLLSIFKEREKYCLSAVLFPSFNNQTITLIS